VELGAIGSWKAAPRSKNQETKTHRIKKPDSKKPRGKGVNLKEKITSGKNLL